MEPETVELVDSPLPTVKCVVEERTNPLIVDQLEAIWLKQEWPMSKDSYVALLRVLPKGYPLLMDGETRWVCRQKESAEYSWEVTLTAIIRMSNLAFAIPNQLAVLRRICKLQQDRDQQPRRLTELTDA